VRNQPSKARELLAVGILGFNSSLGDRIEMLLRRGRTFSPRASFAELALSAVVLGGLLLAGSLAPRWIAFAQQRPRPSFEVASVKPNSSASGNSGVRFTPGRLNAENASLRFLIAWAYKVRVFQLSGGPGWIDSAKYDIDAKAEGNASPDQIRLMLQTLIEERFKLTLRREMKEHALYELVVAKTGLKLKESGADCAALAREDRSGGQPRAQCGAWFSNDTQLNGTKISMSQFVEGLSNFLDLPVIDKTGFAQNFDVHLEWTPDNGGAVPAGLPGDAAGPGIFTAVQEQLGLKLQSAKGPIETLVIDHVEKPSEN
jgi:uncharacterized protein (TIGR03435 family)